MCYVFTRSNSSSTWFDFVGRHHDIHKYFTWLASGGVKHEEGYDTAPGGSWQRRVEGCPVSTLSSQEAWTGKHGGNHNKTHDFASSYPRLQKKIGIEVCMDIWTK